uniref:hypothetical protein n=1 Tax=Erwinia sp. Ejp 556 TaxID=231374 RepID=UPI001564BAC0|nr:hypothetical protein [Erwinia sp. Ejp 556]
MLLAADICRSIGVSREQLSLRIRWCSDSFAFRGDNGEKLRVTFAQDCCDRVNGQRVPVVMIKRRCRMAVQNLVMAFSDYNVHHSHKRAGDNARHENRYAGNYRAPAREKKRLNI